MKTNKIFNVLVVLALLMAVLPVMVVGAAPVPLLVGSVAAVSSSTDDYANLAGLDYQILDNGDGTVTFNLKPTLFDGSPYLQALTVGIKTQAEAIADDPGIDITFGSSDGTPPVDELVLGAGGVYSYTAPAGSLPSGEVGILLMVNGRSSDNGRDLQRWIGITPMTRANDWGGFDWSWANRSKIILPTPTPATSIVPVTDTATFCTGETSKVKINLNDITNLYGYQFQVNYDATKVSATGAFNNSFFDTVGGSTPWNATCAAGKCQFSVSKLGGAPVNGSGTVAEITFTGVNAGEFDVTVSNDILSDRDANAIGHAVGGPLHLTVCGLASVSGVVSLQGRATPINAGTVTLTNGAFGPYTTNFDAVTGAWSISNVKVLPGGTTYTFDAAHGLYLGNRMTHTLTAGSSYVAPNTKLKGGDADNSGLIDVSDITCISGSFGGAPATCGITGSSDINADGLVNILDLVLPGGNYGLTTPQTW